MVLCSHANGTLGTAVFDNVTVARCDPTGTRHPGTDGAHGAGGDEPCGHQPHA